ncbi:hypothetical protein [Ancylomarina longa]|uniref:Uncharacterized protein n=1 Tax=Ancylomarina longa TaxID=2487017 RepID=A0A434AU85_9BACT|nr:hypothetical protein [Ancylomarina longa]RUT77989.1 hypothetical protein DLK05_10075 [Ancylomarina longa]
MQNNLRSKYISVRKDSIALDSLLILPASVKVFHQQREVDKSWYRIDPGKGILIPSEELKRLGDSARIVYRIYPFNVLKPIYQRDLSQLNLAGSSASPRIYSLDHSSDRIGILGNGQLEKQGNYSRAISFGNNQDVVVNSNLNLQLSGKLSDDVNILAAMSDNNIPIQPDGNTQTIQDFDRIYIKLYDETKELTLGDYELESPTGKYMRFYKKVQGGRFSGLIVKGKKSGNELKSTISASIAKGKFNRLEMPGSEGVQGPYRLTGANGETYIIVLSGSEKVFVDGKRLVRGEKNDYVINYNTAELTFTTNQPITRNTRIVVEFEYSEENYARYLLFNSNEYKTKAGKIWFNFYQEQDSKNQSIDQALSDENKQLLASVGDQLNLARVPNVQQVEYSNDFVLYRKITKQIDEQQYEVYEYSTNADSAIYRVNFSFVGSSKGNYRQVNSATNGRVYEWVNPVNGILQGDFEPIVQLIAPQKQQMMTLGADYHLNRNLSTRMELAWSNRDVNTFSALDDSDNQGLAVDFSIQKKSAFADTVKQMKSTFRYHHIQKEFEAIENFRTVEFERDWNISASLMDLDEDYYSLQNAFSNENWGAVSYEIAFLQKASAYQGLKHGVYLNYDKKRWTMKFSGNALTTDQEQLKSKFYRHSLNTSYALSFVKIGVETENENNRWEQKESGLLQPNSFSFYSYKFFIASRDSAINTFQVYYRKRKDFLPEKKDLKAQSESQDFGAEFWLKKNRNNQLKVETVYRKLSILDDSYTDEKPENTFLGKLEHQARIAKGLLQSSTYYELGSGLESEMEFAYVEVNAGQGVYRWSDYNGNDIKELNEFEIASFKDEARYIRVATSTNNYQKVYTSEFRQIFYLRLKHLKSKRKVVGFLSRFSNRFAYRISRKSLNNDFNLYANPFRSRATNDQLLTVHSSFQNTLSYKKAKSPTSWDVIHLSSDSKQLLTQGFERRKFNQDGFRLNWKIGNSNLLTNRIDWSEKRLANEFFTDKDYQLKELKNELKLKFQATLAFQFGLNYTYQQKENHLGTEQSTTHNIGADCNYAFDKSGKLMASINFLNIDFNADSNTSVAYEMLEGFLPGKNASWNLGYNQQLSKIFQLNITYNGRQSEGGKTIHVGSMEVRAYF